MHVDHNLNKIDLDKFFHNPDAIHLIKMYLHNGYRQEH